jgi:hypothetical protein
VKGGGNGEAQGKEAAAYGKVWSELREQRGSWRGKAEPWHKAPVCCARELGLLLGALGSQ